MQEKIDGLWTLPGGYADVGFSAAENACKEVWEEAGIEVRATRLIAVRHKAKHPYPADVRDFYKFMFLCEQVGDGQPTPGAETQGADFFSLDDLPPLSLGRTIEQDISLAFAHYVDADQPTVFD